MNTNPNGNSIYVLGPARTPIGKMMGGLATIPDSQWVADDSAWSQPDLAVFVASLRSSTSLAPVHDVKVVVVSTDPGPVAQQAANVRRFGRERYTSTDLQIYLRLVERGLVREAACHLSLAGHRRLPTPGRPARASPCPILSRQAKITRLRG